VFKSRKAIDLESFLQGHPVANRKCEDGFELAAYGFLYTILAFISDRLATGAKLYPKMDDLEILGSRSSKVRCENGFEFAAYEFLFTPHNYYFAAFVSCSCSCL